MHLRVKGSHTPLSQSVAAWQRLPKPHRLLTCNAQIPPLHSSTTSSGASGKPQCAKVSSVACLQASDGSLIGGDQKPELSTRAALPTGAATSSTAEAAADPLLTHQSTSASLAGSICALLHSSCTRTQLGIPSLKDMYRPAGQLQRPSVVTVPFAPRDIITLTHCRFAAQSRVRLHRCPEPQRRLHAFAPPQSLSVSS